MIKTNIPVLTRKVKTVEWQDYMKSLLSAGLASATLLDDKAISKAIKNLKERAASGYREKFRLLRESKGSLLYSIDTASKNAKRPLSADVWTLLSCLYAESVLVGRYGDGRLIERLDSSQSVYDSTTGQVATIATQNCFKQKGNVASTLLTEYSKVERLLMPSGSFLSPNDIKALEDFLAVIMSYEQLDTSVYTTEAAVELSLLATHLRSLSSIFPKTASTVGIKYTVHNASQIKLPEFLDNTNAPQLLRNLALSEKAASAAKDYNEMAMVCLKDIVSVSSIGEISINPAVCERFLDHIFRTYSEVNITYEAFERHLNVRDKYIPEYLRYRICDVASGGAPLDEAERKLCRAYLPVTKTPVVQTYPLVEMREKIDSFKAQLSDVIPAIVAVIDKYYTTDISRYFKGCNLTRSYVNRNDIIYRIERSYTFKPEKSYDLLKFNNTKSRKLTSVNKINSTISSKKLVRQDDVRTNYLGLEKVGKITPTSLQSIYGVAVVGVDYDSLRRAVTDNATVMYIEHEEVTHTTTFWYEIHLVTIDPPAAGPDHQSFGITTRRSNPSLAFEIRNLDPVESAVDIVDLLMSFPSNVCAGFELNSEKLAQIYDSRIASLREDASDVDAIWYDEVRGIEVLDFRYDMYARLHNQEPEKRLLSKMYTVLISSQTTIADLSSNKLPAYCILDRYQGFTMYVPFEYLHPSVQSVVNVMGTAHGVQLDDGTFTWEVRPIAGHVSGAIAALGTCTESPAEDETVTVVTTDTVTVDANGNPLPKPKKVTKKENQTIRTAFGEIVDVFQGHDLYALTVRCDVRDGMRAALETKPKNPKTVNFQSLAKNQVLRFFDYGSININGTLANDKDICYIHDSKAVKISDCVARRNRISNLPEGESYKSNVRVALSVLSDMIMSAMTAFSGIWGTGFDRSKIDEAVLQHEVKSLADYIEVNYDPTMRLSLLDISSTSDVSSMVQVLRKLEGTLNASASRHDVFEALSDVYAMFDVLGSSKLYLYQGIGPKPIDAFDYGYIDMVLTGCVSSVVIPRAIASQVNDYWDRVLNESIGSGEVCSSLCSMLIDFVNSNAARGKF